MTNNDSLRPYRISVPQPEIDDLRERLASRDLEADFDAANELYKLLRSL